MSTRARPSLETMPRLKAMSGTFSTAMGLSDQAAAVASVGPAPGLSLPRGGPASLGGGGARVCHRRLALRVAQRLRPVGFGERDLLLVLGEGEGDHEGEVPLQVFDESPGPQGHVAAEG